MLASSSSVGASREPRYFAESLFVAKITASNSSVATVSSTDSVHAVQVASYAAVHSEVEAPMHPVLRRSTIFQPASCAYPSKPATRAPAWELPMRATVRVGCSRVPNSQRTISESGALHGCASEPLSTGARADAKPEGTANGESQSSTSAAAP